MPKRATGLADGPGMTCWAVFRLGRPEKHGQSSVSGQPEAHKRGKGRAGGRAATEGGALAPEADPAASALALEVGPCGEAWRRR